MSSFATELSSQLTSRDNYWDQLRSLQSAGVRATLSQEFIEKSETPTADMIASMLYCASVFVQTEDSSLQAMAQTIALNALLVDEGDETKERSFRVLTELGNFPGLKYVESQRGPGDVTLLGLLNRRISESLNTVDIGSVRMPLTDYQKGIWDALPDAKYLAISAPTSAGKSFLVVEHLCRLTSSKPSFTAVYIAPTRALLSEVYQKVKIRLHDVDDVRISSVPSLDSEGHSRQVFVLTQERLQVLLSVSTISFDLVVVDEAQNLSDNARGMILQECLEKVVERNKATQVIMLSPGAEGFPDVAKTIGLSSMKLAGTTLSPVLQNRILVNRVVGADDLLRLGLLTSRGSQEIGIVKAKRGLVLPATRLATVALELGSDGGSLVYATGPSDAERVATQIMVGREDRHEASLNELAAFIQKHIHPDYRLAAMVRRGVSFHYGRMPGLLREAIETEFKTGGLQFLTCTTTLFQGVNLPARNVFINTPTRGKRGEKLDPALLWNFAGRAGRLSKDIVGNVFLVDYDEWEDKPMDSLVRFRITPAITAALTQSYDEVMIALGGNMPRLARGQDKPGQIRASAGLLISRAARGDIRTFLKRVLPQGEPIRAEALALAADAAAKTIELPPELLESNWTIDPFGQQRLYKRIVEKIRAGEVDELIPLNPHETTQSHYVGIFKRILREVLGQEGNFGALVATLAIPWMKGIPYPVILSHWIKGASKRAEKLAAAQAEEDALNPPKRRRRAPKELDTNRLIRQAFDLIEDAVRFQFVQLGKAYIDLLMRALREEGLGDKVASIFDFSLALELGVATRSGTSFVELGLSRISACALEALFPNSSLSVDSARKALWELDVKAASLSPVIVEEMQRLRLLKVDDDVTQGVK